MIENELRSGPPVSIGLPVYNGGDYLEECLESVRQQTYQNWECVIVDNQSRDDTSKIAKRFVEKDKRFQLHVNEKFVDQAENWNISFRIASKQAKYFKIVCADDWLFPEYLECMVPAMEAKREVGLCSSYRIDGARVGCGGLDYYHGSYFDGKEILIRHLKKELFVLGSAHTVLFRAETLKQLEYYPDIFRADVYHCDTVLAYDVLNISDLAFIFRVLSYTRRHNETYTAKVSARFETTFYLQDLALKKFMHLDRSLVAVYQTNKIDYAYYLLKMRLQRDKECVEWHNKYRKESFRWADYILAVFKRNMIARKLKKLMR